MGTVATDTSYFLPHSPMTLPYKPLIGSLAAVSILSASAVAFAQGNAPAGVSGSGMRGADRPVPTQECLLAMTDLGETHLAHFDEHMADQKTRLQEHLEGMRTIAAIADDAERAAAMKAKHDEMKDKEPPTPPADVVAAMDAVKAACGDVGFHGPGMAMKFKKGPGGPDRGHRGTFMKRAPMPLTE